MALTAAEVTAWFLLAYVVFTAVRLLVRDRRLRREAERRALERRQAFFGPPPANTP